MYLLDYPFVSEYLIQTLKKNKSKIIATDSARQLILDDDLHWISEEEAIEKLEQSSSLPLYSNSENALGWIEHHLGETSLAKSVKMLKDKMKFREMLKDIFPDFKFKKIALDDIQNYPIENPAFPFVLKPTIGFFSIGVHIIEDEDDWAQAKMKLQLDNLAGVFPKSVIDTTNFIIEDVIQGEEYAIDYYYNDLGEAVILNISHHIFSSGTDTSDRVYTSSKDIIYQNEATIGTFLNKIGKQLKVKNFPAHAEVRIDKEGKVVPIEINPLRFGGWCTTGDLLGVALGYNAYEYFMKNRKPDWDKIFKGKEDKKYSIVILDNSTGVDPSKIQGFDYASLEKDLENPILVRKLDIKKYPVFGFIFAETSASNQGELDNILVSDLKEYIRLSAN